MGKQSMFQDKSVVITGASSGLGAALGLELARAGARVALFSPESERLKEVAERCAEAGAQALAVIGDVTLPDDCRRLMEETVAEFGGIDYLIANAGISMWAKFEDVEDLGVFRKLMEVNYQGAVNCAYHALPHLKQRRGMLVAITSIQSKIGVPLHTGYVASKHALQGFCESLRMELDLDGAGVDILTVLPHWLRGTELREHALSKEGKELGTSSRKHSSESVSVEDACKAILKAMRKRKRELVIPWKLKLLLGLNLIRPQLAESIITGKVRHQDRR
ncbi:MAG TPA: SDR family oxidoreductase [Candidatus Latescibacteria bacterium]|nr:SDR family oxidoreductase [Candidatus Latescibacterota bacterium]HIM55696.1 SDR family oxidoreductase [Candidatus Latescibacterota bacterium]